MATLSDLLAAMQNGVVAINRYRTAFVAGFSSSPPATNPGGAHGQTQFNNSGSFGGFTWGGDATLTSSNGIMTVSPSVVTYAKIQNVSVSPAVWGSSAGGSITELKSSQATAILGLFSSGNQGLIPASGGGTLNFQRADGAFAITPGEGTVSGPGSSLTVAGDFATWSSSTGKALADTTPASATATLTLFSSTAQGLVAASTGSSINFLEGGGDYVPIPTTLSLPTVAFWTNLPPASANKGAMYIINNALRGIYHDVASSIHLNQNNIVYSDGSVWRNG